MNPPNLIDRSLKVLIRRAAPAFLRLLGLRVDPGNVRLGDLSINVPEYRADQLFLIGGESDPDRWGLHLEYQLQPDLRVLPGWLFKNAAFNVQLGIPTVLAVVYLARGDRATFPSIHRVEGGGLANEYRFHTIRLWEHAERIRNGELRELAPLLILCEDKPSEETLRAERELILGMEAPDAVRVELLGVAVMVGTRHFARGLLERLFREELQMLKEASFIEEWIQEGIEKGKQEGMREGMREGEARGARQVLLRQLRKCFGELPASVVARVESADHTWCEEMGERLLDATSLEELGFARDDGAGAAPIP